MDLPGAAPYAEAIEVWKTNCPRHSLWEDALADGLMRVVRNGSETHITLTPEGESLLRLSRAARR